MQQFVSSFIFFTEEINSDDENDDDLHFEIEDWLDDESRNTYDDNNEENED